MTKLKSKLLTLFIAFISAVLMVIYVHASVMRLSTNTDNTVSVQTSRVIEGVPISIIDTSNSKYVSGLPEKVDVVLRGPRNLLSQFNAQNIVVQTIDFAPLINGNHTISLVVTGLPTNVTGEVVESLVIAQVQNLETKTVQVNASVPSTIVATGYLLENITVEPSHIILSGSAEVLEKVDNVTASVSAEVLDRTESFTQKNIAVVVKDSQGNILDVKANKTVSVSVGIVQNVYTVPLQISLVGQNDAYTYTVSAQSLSTTKIATTNTTSSIEKIQRVNAVVDVSGMNVSSVVEVPILVPNGVTLTQDKTVRVSVTVAQK